MISEVGIPFCYLLYVLVICIKMERILICRRMRNLDKFYERVKVVEVGIVKLLLFVDMRCMLFELVSDDSAYLNPW